MRIKRALRVKLQDQLTQQEQLLTVVSAMEGEVETHSHYGAACVVPSREAIEREYYGRGDDL